jgi:methylthioribulose-1-phosphate dehydratase
MMVAMPALAEVARSLAELGRQFHARGWVLGTSGNFSAVLEAEPLRLAITPSGADKGTLSPEQLLEIDADAAVLRGRGRPSDETRLHLAVVKARGAGAVLHTHSVWGTMLSTTHARAGGVAIEQLEMLKGLAGVKTHAHREWLPIFENSQDMPELSGRVAEALAADPRAHGFLLRGHGLYTWGRDLDEARRHVEILEFLLEVTGRLAKGD